MKKKLFSLLPLLFLVGCAQPQVASEPVQEMFVTYEQEMPVIHRDGSGNVTYLMLSKYGRIQVGDQLVAGVDVPEKFYENCVAYEAAVGSDLPVAVSTLDDVVFRGWFKYTNKIYPEKVEKVVAGENTVYAIFDGPTGGGGGVVTEGYGFKFSDGTKVAAVDGGLNPDGLPQYSITNYTFTAGKSFALYDFGADTTWVVDINPWSFGGTDTAPKWNTYISKGTDSYTVLQTFTADVYIVLVYGSDNVYFGLK